jgi:hypothetical protein
VPLNPALTPNITSTENPKDIRKLYVYYVYYTKIGIIVFNKQSVITRTWNTYTLSTNCRPKNGMCWRRRPKKEENQEIEIHTKKNITVLFYRRRHRGPPATLVLSPKEHCVTSQMAVIFTITTLGKSKLTTL